MEQLSQKYGTFNRYERLRIYKYSTNYKCSNFSSISDLKIINTRDSYDEEIFLELDEKLFGYFKNTKKIGLYYVEETEIANILKYAKDLDSLEITESSTQMLEYIGGFEKIINQRVRHLKYESDKYSYLCQNDFESFEKLESLTLILHNNMLEFEIHRWNHWKNLKKVKIIIPNMVFYEIEETIVDWELKYPQITFCIKPESVTD